MVIRKMFWYYYYYIICDYILFLFIFCYIHVTFYLLDHIIFMLLIYMLYYSHAILYAYYVLLFSFYINILYYIKFLLSFLFSPLWLADRLEVKTTERVTSAQQTIAWRPPRGQGSPHHMTVSIITVCPLSQLQSVVITATVGPLSQLQSALYHRYSLSSITATVCPLSQLQSVPYYDSS